MKLCYESVYIVFNLVASNRSGGNLLYDSTFRVNKRHYRRYIFIRLVWTRNRSIFPIVKSNAFTNFENVETRLKIAPIQNRWIFEAKERREKKRAAITRSISSPFNDSFSISFSLEKKISRFSKFTSRNVFYPSPSIKQLLRKKNGASSSYLVSSKRYINHFRIEVIDTLLLNEIIWISRFTNLLLLLLLFVKYSRSTSRLIARNSYNNGSFPSNRIERMIPRRILAQVDRRLSR